MATELHFRFAINETMLKAVSMPDNELCEIKEKLEVEQEIANCKACSLVAMFFTRSRYCMPVFAGRLSLSAIRGHAMHRVAKNLPETSTGEKKMNAGNSTLS